MARSPCSSMLLSARSYLRTLAGGFATRQAQVVVCGSYIELVIFRGLRGAGGGSTT